MIYISQHIKTLQIPFKLNIFLVFFMFFSKFLVDQVKQFSIKLMHVLQEQDFCKLYQENIHKEDTGDYSWIFKMRIIIIFISTLALLINIFVIIAKKQYKFNTIRLLLFVLIFYALSLISVTPHSQNFNYNQTQKPEQFPEYMKCLVKEGEPYKCAIQGFINLACYSISYWFAVCITLYIRLVLQNNHKRFMKKKGPIIFLGIFVIIVWYLIPFVLTFLDDVLFSFGPTGYWFGGRNYLFYSGIVNRKDTTPSKALVIVWMLVLPIGMFIYHLRLLIINYRYIKRLKQLDELNPRQLFLIRSGRLSLLIFAVQISNVGKLIISFFVDQDTQILAYLVFGLNVIFDLLALVLVWMYLKFYYKTGIYLQQNSEIMNTNLTTTLAALSTSLF